MPRFRLCPADAGSRAGDERSREYGCCILTNVLSAARIAAKEKMDEQYEAEEALGELTFERGLSNKIVIPNLVNKGQHYLDLVTHDETEAFASHV